MCSDTLYRAALLVILIAFICRSGRPEKVFFTFAPLTYKEGQSSYTRLVRGPPDYEPRITTLFIIASIHLVAACVCAGARTCIGHVPGEHRSLDIAPSVAHCALGTAHCVSPGCQSVKLCRSSVGLCRDLCLTSIGPLSGVCRLTTVAGLCRPLSGTRLKVSIIPDPLDLTTSLATQLASVVHIRQAVLTSGTHIPSPQ